MTRAPSRYYQMMARSARGDVADQVPIQGGTLTFPDTPDGFSPITLYAFDSFFTLDPTAVVDTVQVEFTTPFQITADDVATGISALQSALQQLGYDVAAYAAFEQPAVSIAVPSQICVAGLPCWDLTQVCLPIVGCIGGATLVTGFTYVFWILTYQTTVATGYVARGEVRGQITIVTAILAFFLSVASPWILAEIKSILWGQATPASVTTDAQKILKAPGDNLAAATQGISTPIIIVGLATVVGAIAIAALTGQPPKSSPVPVSFSGNVNLPLGPGSVGASGTVGTGRS